MPREKSLREMMQDDSDPAASDAKAFESIHANVRNMSTARQTSKERRFRETNRGMKDHDRGRSDELREAEAFRGGKLQLRTPNAMLDKSTKGSPPFSASELQKGYRKL